MGDNTDLLVEKLKEKGLSCGKLRSKEMHERKEASEFRKYEFNNIANAHESSANVIKSLRQKVCKLR